MNNANKCYLTKHLQVITEIHSSYICKQFLGSALISWFPITWRKIHTLNVNNFMSVPQYPTRVGIPIYGPWPKDPQHQRLDILVGVLTNQGTGLKTVLNTSEISSGISVHALPYCLYILFDVGSDQICAWKAGYHVNVDSLLWCLQYLDPRLNFKYPESSLCTCRSTHWCVQCLDPRLYVGVPGACGVPLVARLVVTGSRHAC